MRSFGNRVCDCTRTDRREIFDKTKYLGKEYEKGEICAACHSFGCTGLARAFTLHVNAEHALSSPIGKSTLEMDVPNRGIARYSYTTGWTDRFSMTLSCRRALSWPHDTHWGKNHFYLPPEVVLATFLMLEYGTLGAMDQYGCGLVRMINRTALIDIMQSALKDMNEGKAKPENGVANLQDFYFFKGTVDNTALKKLCDGPIVYKGTKTQAPAPINATIRIRRLLRDAIRKIPGPRSTDLRHWLCGALNEAGSHISVGVSNGTLYGWGWVPNTGIVLKNKEHISLCFDERKTILRTIHSCLKSVCADLVWSEYNHEGDKKTPQDWQQFVQNMIATPWRKA